MVTVACLQTDVCQTRALDFVGIQTSGALNEGLFFSGELLQDIVPSFMAPFPCFHPLGRSFSHQNCLHQENSPPTWCVNKAPSIISVYVDATSSVHENEQLRSSVPFVHLYYKLSFLGQCCYAQIFSCFCIWESVQGISAIRETVFHILTNSLFNHLFLLTFFPLSLLQCVKQQCHQVTTVLSAIPSPPLPNPLDQHPLPPLLLLSRAPHPKKRAKRRSQRKKVTAGGNTMAHSRVLL